MDFAGSTSAAENGSRCKVVLWWPSVIENYELD